MFVWFTWTSLTKISQLNRNYLHKTMNSHDHAAFIRKPTRFATSHTWDLSITPRSNLDQFFWLPRGGNHSPIVAKPFAVKWGTTNGKLGITCGSYSDHNIFEVHDKLSDFIWNSINTVYTHSYTTSFINMFDTLYCEYCPICINYVTKKVAVSWMIHFIFEWIEH